MFNIVITSRLLVLIHVVSSLVLVHQFVGLALGTSQWSNENWRYIYISRTYTNQNVVALHSVRASRIHRGRSTISICIIMANNRPLKERHLLCCSTVSSFQEYIHESEQILYSSKQCRYITVFLLHPLNCTLSYWYSSRAFDGPVDTYNSKSR